MKLSVKAYRVNSGKTQEEVAKAVNLSPRMYSRKENGHSPFYAHELATLSVLLGVPLANFSELSCPEQDT